MSFSPLASVKTDTFEPPNPQEFYQRFFGHGDWSFTRPMALFLIVGIVVCTYLVMTTRKAAIVPSRGQWITASVKPSSAARPAASVKAARLLTDSTGAESRVR